MEILPELRRKDGKRGVIMDKELFRSILSNVVSACKASFYNGITDIRPIVLECATRIYLAERNGTRMDGGAENDKS